MPNALTNTNISATYKGVLHADGEPIPASGLKPVYDGTGVQSALSIGRSNQGATVTGYLSSNDIYAGQLRMPNVDKGIQHQVVARTASGVLELKSLSELITDGDETELTNGVYYNPKITVNNGVITNIESRPVVVMIPTSQIQTLIPLTTYTVGASVTSQHFNINWGISDSVIRPGYSIDARYAIITVTLTTKSAYLKFSTSLSMDSEVIGKTTISTNITEDFGRLDENTYTYMNQLIVKMPVANLETQERANSLFLYSIGNIENNESKLNKQGRTNTHSVEVKLNGWIF